MTVIITDKDRYEYRIVCDEGYLVAKMSSEPNRGSGDGSDYFDLNNCSYHALLKRLDVFNCAEIPAVLKDATLENITNDKTPTPSINRAYSWIVKWSQSDPLPVRGILLSGPSGAGKSYALAGLIRYVTLELGVSCLFVDFRQFLLQLKKCYEGNGQDFRLFEKLRRVPILFLDDVGISRNSEWAGDVIRTIISQRYNDVKRTFLTTDLSITSSSQNAVDTFTKTVGVHCASRLRQMCYWLPFIGPDRRYLSDPL